MASRKKTKASKAAGASARAGATRKKSAAKKKSTSKRAKKAVKKTAKKTAAKPARKAAKNAAKKKAPARKAAKPVKAKKTAPKRKQQIVGEGDYAATRAFDRDEAAFVKKNKAKIPAMGKAAEAALDGPEGDALRAAEATAAGRSRDTF